MASFPGSQIVVIALAISSISVGAFAASKQNLELSLVSKIKSGSLLVKNGLATSTRISSATEIIGFKCEPLAEFSKSEGLDTVVRLLALKELRKVLSSQGIQISDEQMHAVKSVSVDQLDNFSVDKSKSQKNRDLSLLLLKRENGKRVNLQLYIAKIKKAQALLWSRMSQDLKSHILAEVSAQTGFNADQELKGQNLLLDLDVSVLNKSFVKALNKTVLCFADLQSSDTEKLTVLIPVKSNQLDLSRSLLDVGHALEKLDAGNILVPEQE